SNINFTIDTGGSISGKIISETTFEPIPYINVTAFDYDTGEWLIWGTTITDGTYTVNGLPTGRYKVYAGASDNNLPYTNEYYNNVTYSEAATPVYVTKGKDTPNINFILTPSHTTSLNKSLFATLPLLLFLNARGALPPKRHCRPK
ncbi:MAG: carboxypeptidase-like regulatory domain-containing protein, partial [Dehalococcoidales bacterium]